MRFKRGVSTHLEMVISFVLFILFIFFLIMYIQPYNSKVLSDSLIISLKGSFFKEVSTSYTSVFLRKDASLSGCFLFVTGDSNAQGGSLVINADNGEIVNSGFQVRNLDPDKPSNVVVVGPSLGNAFYVLISPDFTNSLDFSGCELAPPENYSIGSVDSMSLISSRSLQEPKNQDYQGLKDRLGFPQSVDFSIMTSDGNYSLNKDVPLGIEVNARTYIYPVLYADGSIKNKEFVFSVW